MGGKKTNATDMAVAARIRWHRKRCGITQGELAGKLGLTFQQVQKYEKGINRIGAGRLYELATIFNVSISDLYPPPELSADQDEPQQQEAIEGADFILHADGLRLMRSFMKIKNHQFRENIILMVEKIASSNSTDN